MKKLILVAILLGASACATRPKVDPLLIPPEHDAHPNQPTGT